MAFITVQFGIRSYDNAFDLYWLVWTAASVRRRCHLTTVFS